MNDYDPYGPQRSNIFRHAGFRVGIVGAIIMIVVHLFALLINHGNTSWDLYVWFLQLIVYFFAAQSAAQQHYNARERSPEALRGVIGAGVGAALTISFLLWLYIILRGVLRDALGITINVEPISLFCIIVLDVLLALGLGALGGKIVANKYKNFTGY